MIAKTSFKHVFGPAVLLALCLVCFACSDSRTDSGSDLTIDDSSDSQSTVDSTEQVDLVANGLCEDDESETLRPSFWEKSSHCKGEPANYDLLFDDTVVHRMDITISADNYAATMADLSSLLGSSSGLGGPGGPVGVDLDEDPIYVPVTVQFKDKTWTHVGMRYKGNSSLSSAWQSGVRKLSFRFNFDKFEDDYPEIENQRFYGFKKMTFSNGYLDDSLMRDKLAADLFRAGGVPAARGAFVRVYVDFGEGETYFGLYTMIEDPSDEMLGVQFDDDDGNLYKPEEDCATWACFDEEAFVKKTNEDDEDWSDIIAAVEALNADSADVATWRADLEAVFDVELFLRWLAINQAMQNWDTYGAMTHNYYVYRDSSDGGRLKWFPWDLNESMLDCSGPGTSNTSVYLEQTDSSWPLIRFLLDDPVYRAQYTQELEAALAGPLDMDAFAAKAQAYHDLIAPYVIGDEGEASPYTFLDRDSDFEDSVDGNGGLIAHISGRHSAVAAAIAAE